MLGKFFIGLNAFFDQSLGIRPDFLLIRRSTFNFLAFSWNQEHPNPV